MKNKRLSFALAFKFLRDIEAIRQNNLNRLFKNLDRGRQSTAEELNKIGHN